MKKFFDMNSPVMVSLGKVTDCIWMSLLWLLCSLPLFTLGAATTALYRNMMHIRENKETGASFFFHSFVENFKKSTLCWMIIALMAGLVVLVGYGTFHLKEAPTLTAMSAILLLCSILVLVIFIYVFPLLSFFENTVGNTMKNAFLIGIRNPLCTLLASAFILAPVVLYLLNPFIFLYLFPVWIFAWPGTAAYIMSKRFRKVFLQYVPKEPEESEEPKELNDEDSED